MEERKEKRHLQGMRNVLLAFAFCFVCALFVGVSSVYAAKQECDYKITEADQDFIVWAKDNIFKKDNIKQYVYVTSLGDAWCVVSSDKPLKKAYVNDHWCDLIETGITYGDAIIKGGNGSYYYHTDFSYATAKEDKFVLYYGTELLWSNYDVKGGTAKVVDNKWVCDSTDTVFFFATAKLDGQHQGTTESGEDSDKGNSDSGGILDGIVNWLSGILSKIKELPALVFDAFKTALQTIADKVGKIASEVYDFFKPFIDFVKTSFKFIKKVLRKIGTTIFNAFSDTLGKIIDGILAIPEAVGEFIKNLFVPKDGEMDKALDKLKSAFGGLLYSYELTSLATGSKEFGDITCTLYGKKVTILDASLVLKGVGFFRSIIRGFIALLLVLFNVNQFLGFIGQPAISIVGGIRAMTQGGDKSETAKGD